MNKNQALKYLYRLLAQRDYLSYDLKYKLKKKDFSNEVIEESINYLKEISLINDEEYIKTFIEFNMKKLEGPYKIKNKLIIKQIDPNTVDSLIFEKYSTKLQEKNINDLLKRKKIDKNSLLNIKEKNKIISYFIRKGYDMDLIINKIEKLLNP